jgi:N,N'-diacetylchitobiose transport system substrate-binding protein
MPAHRLTSRLANRLAGIAVATVTALTVAACSDGSGSGTSAQGDKRLTVWIMEGTNPDATPFFDRVTADFKRDTGADLNIQFVPWSAAHDKFVSAVGGGETPDVAEFGTTWTPEFGEAGILTDLTGRVKDSPVAGDLLDSLVIAGTIDGKMYGMPWYAGVRSVIYRTDVFQELGLEPPTTWDEWVTAGKAIKDARPDLVTMPVAGNNEYGVYPFVWGAGGEIATRQDGIWTSRLDSAEARRGIAFYTGLATEHGLSSPAASTWKETDLRDNFIQDAEGHPGEGPAARGQDRCLSHPGPDGGISPSFVGGSHLAIFEKSGRADLAWTFVEMMTVGRYASEWANQSSYFPGLKSLLDKATAQPDPLVAPFAKQMKDGGETVPVTPAYGKVQAKKTVPSMLQAILSGNKTVEQATADAASEMTAELRG